MPSICCLQDFSKLRRFWDRAVQHLGVRNYSELVVSFLRNTRARVMHSHFGSTGWNDIAASRKAKIPHLVSFYGYDISYLPTQFPIWRCRYLTLFAQSERILCEGPHMANCLERLGCPAGKIKIHHLGVPVEEIPFKLRTHLPWAPFRVLMAASFQEKKGIPYAIEALGRLQREVPLEITVIGDANSEARSQAEKERIFGSIKKHQLQSKIRILGYQPLTVLRQEAYTHHAFLSPSVTAVDGDTEGGLPVVLIEMMASGIPVVSTRHCDIPAVVHHGVTGLLAEERSVDDLFSHLMWLLQHRKESESMAVAGRRLVEENFNARVQGSRLASAYSELSNQKA